MQAGTHILELEVRAARLSATLDARPELGALWRRMVALSEAAASMSLEMISIPESDILRPPLGLGTAKGEPQSARTAREIYRFLLRPGSLRSDPVGVFDRAVEATRITDVIDDGDGGYVYYPIDVEIDLWQSGRRIFAQEVPRILRHRPPPILGALAIARLASECMPDPHPLTERLLFCAAEHELRRDLVFSDPIVSRRLEGLHQRVDANWACPPALALARGGLRSWALRRAEMRDGLVQRLHDTLGRETGRLGPLQAWSDRLDEDFQDRTQRSRRAAFAELVRQTPILNGAAVAKGLGVTERAARNFLEDAHRQGHLRLLTLRRSYRLWAVPALADMIEERRENLGRLRSREAELPEPKDEGVDRRPTRSLEADQDFEARCAVILADIDKAMAGVDALNEKYRKA